MKMSFEVDVWEEFQLDETTGEIVIRPRAEAQDSLLGFSEEAPYWRTLLCVLNEHFIEPYTIPDSLDIPEERDYHYIVAASEDLLKIAQDFKKNVDELHLLSKEERDKRNEKLKFPFENHGPGPDEDR